MPFYEVSKLSMLTFYILLLTKQFANSCSYQSNSYLISLVHYNIYIYISGVPKLNRAELETACEDFSNITGTLPNCTLYKGTLSSGVEIAVASTTIKSAKDWSEQAEVHFRKKVLTFGIL